MKTAVEQSYKLNKLGRVLQRRRERTGSTRAADAAEIGIASATLANAEVPSQKVSGPLVIKLLSLADITAEEVDGIIRGIMDQNPDFSISFKNIDPRLIRIVMMAFAVDRVSNSDNPEVADEVLDRMRCELNAFSLDFIV